MKELLSIVAHGMDTGANVGEAIDLFITRMSREIELENKVRIKIGGAQSLTYLGMAVFFPLFSGISMVILQSSYELSGSAPVSWLSFTALSCAYVLIILYISTAFAHPENSMPRNALSILPYFISALFIMAFVPRALTSVL